MNSPKEPPTDGAGSAVQDAEREVARSKLQFQESLQLASAAGSRLAANVRRKLRPSVLIAVAGGVVVVAGVVVLASRGQQRRVRASARPSATGIVARAAAVWVLRAAALRLAVMLATKLRHAQSLHPPASAN